MKALPQRDLDVLWHPCSQMSDYQDFEPIEIVGAKGSKLHLANGEKVLDAISSWWCKSLGHCHPQIQAAIQKQSQSFEQVILANTTNELVVRFCERILNIANAAEPSTWSADSSGLAPGFYQKVFLADNGSTAVEIAMKMAVHAQAQRGQGKRKQFMALENGYHGETIATLSAGDCGLYSDPYKSLMFDVPKIKGLPYRSGPLDPLWMDASKEWPAIEKQLNKQASKLAAIMYEPVLQGAGGMLLYSPDFLVRLRAWADQNDVYLIADEIAAGMGRCGSMLASHLAKTQNEIGFAQADFAVLSKGLTSGTLPLSAVLTSNAIYDIFVADYFEFKAFMHSNTYTGNALALAVAHATLDIYADEKIIQHVERMHKLLIPALQGLAEQRKDIKNLRCVGLMAAMDITSKSGAPLEAQQRTGYQLFQQSIKLGAWLRPLGDTMYIFPPLNISDHDLLKIVDVLRKSMKVVLDNNRDTLGAV